MPRPESTALIDGVCRVSTLRTFNSCPQAAAWTLEDKGDWSSEEAALGTAAHGVLERVLLKLAATGRESVDFDEALSIMEQVAADPAMPHLSARSLATLKIIVLQMSKMQWTASAIVGVEQRLFADVVCPDGRTRRLTGQPDVLQLLEPGVAGLTDLKTAWNAPARPRDDDWTRDQGRAYISDNGWFQLDCFSLLVMRNYPNIHTARILEWYPRAGELDPRVAWVTRDQLPEVERRVGTLLQRFGAMVAGEPAEARAGSHCRRICPRPFDCPVPPQERRSIITGDGCLTDADQAGEAGRVFAAVDGQRDRLVSALKGWCEDGNAVILEDGAGYVGWKINGNGSRRFGVHAGQPDREAE
jgi:PD-(D/E)XK nuclease superfamily protein